MKDILDILNMTKLSSSEIFVPLDISLDMLNLPNQEIFTPEFTAFDPAVKSGRFLINLCNLLMTSDKMIEAFPDEKTRRVYIIEKQLFGIATSDKARAISSLNLMGNSGARCNIISIDGYKDIIKDRTRYTDLISRRFNRMKFDLVVGNPPYNNDLYLDFVRRSHELSSKYTLMITPAKWQAKTDGKPATSKSPDKNVEFRRDIVPYMSHIVYYRDTHEIFDIDDNSGMCYYLIDKNNNHTKMVKSMCKTNNILESEWEEHDEDGVILLPRKMLSVIGKIGQLGAGFRQSLYVKNTETGESNIMGQLGFKRFTYTSEQERGEFLKQAGYVGVMQGSKVSGYMDINKLFTTDRIDKWKCIVSCMLGGALIFGNDTKVIGSPKLHKIGPYQVPKGSFPVIKYFDTPEECDSLISYIESKTVSYLIYCGVVGATLTKEFFRFVPDPKDWTVTYVDRAHQGAQPDKFGKYTLDGKTYCSLYSKYNLTEDDISIIESIIKSRN